MAVTPRAANVGTVTHPVTLPARSLAHGAGSAPRQLVLAAVMLLAWGFAFGASPAGVLAAARLDRSRLARRHVPPARPRRVPPRARRSPRPSCPGRHARHGARRRIRRPSGHGRRASPARRRLPARLPRGRRLGRAPASRADDRAPAAGAGPGRGRGGREPSREHSTSATPHGVELVGFVGNHSHAVVPVLGELDDLAEVVRALRDRRDRPDRQPPPPAAARAPARRRAARRRCSS